MRVQAAFKGLKSCAHGRVQFRDQSIGTSMEGGTGEEVEVEAEGRAPQWADGEGMIDETITAYSHGSSLLTEATVKSLFETVAGTLTETYQANMNRCTGATLYTIHYTLYTHTLYTIHYTLYTIQYKHTLYTIN